MALPTAQTTLLFDTTVFIDHFRKKNANAKVLLAQVASGKVVASISVITSAELWRGVCGRSDERDHELVISPFERIPVTHELAVRGGELACLCDRDGYKVSVADGILGATAEKYNLTVVTGNSKHFNELQKFANFKIQEYGQ